MGRVVRSLEVGGEDCGDCEQWRVAVRCWREVVAAAVPDTATGEADALPHVLTNHDMAVDDPATLTLPNPN